MNPGDVGEQLYNYDQRNLLTNNRVGAGNSVYDPAADYVYDGAGNRVQQVDYTGSQPMTTTYTNDNLGLSQVLVANNGITTTHNLFGPDLIHQDDGTTTRTLLADGLGSARTEMVGSTIESVTTYEPYGNPLAQTGTSGTTYGFTGEQHDAATGLLYLRARYYNPHLNQFQSRDPFAGYAKLPVSQNGYGYVHGNPVKYTDPSGHCIVGYSGEVRMNQYPYGTSGICPNTEHWITEAHAAIADYDSSGPKRIAVPIEFIITGEVATGNTRTAFEKNDLPINHRVTLVLGQDTTLSLASKVGDMIIPSSVYDLITNVFDTAYGASKLGGLVDNRLEVQISTIDPGIKVIIYKPQNNE